MGRIVLFCIVAFCILGIQAGEIVIAERTGGVARVALPDNPTEVERYAAQELRSWSAKLVGADVMRTNATEVVLRRSDAQGPDGFELSVEDGKLVVAGGERGVLYGVYELLESQGGISWLSSWWTDIPKRERFTVVEGYRFSDRPAFQMRASYWTDAFDGDFAARLRHNSNVARLAARHGGHPYRFGGGLGTCHTFAKLLPVAKYGKAHPEYFALRKGKRTLDAEHPQQKVQLCLTNPDVLRIVTSNVLAAIKADPTAKYYGVSQNDNAEYCECPACAAIDAEEDSHAGTLVRFVNAIAEEVEKTYPDKVIETLAYWYTRKPPKKTKLRHNVMPCLCSLECDFVHPLATGAFAQNVKFREDIKKWAAQASRLFVWDYTASFLHYLTPFPNIPVLQDNIRFYRDNGVVDLFEQGAYQGWHGEFAELKAYLLAKWLWNPDLPAEPLIDRFLKGYYGAAAPIVRTYFDKLESLPKGVKPDAATGIWINPKYPIYPKEFAAEAVALWKRAIEAVKGDDGFSYNVRTSALPAYYLRVMRDLSDALDTPPEKARALTPAERAEREALVDFIVSVMDEAKEKGRPVRISETDKYNKLILSQLLGNSWVTNEERERMRARCTGYEFQPGTPEGDATMFYTNAAKTAGIAFNYDEAAAGEGTYKLEDPLAFADGRKVKNASDWGARRREILSLFERELYGKLPPKPAEMTFEIVKEELSADRFATLRTYRQYFRKDKTGPVIDWFMALPRHAREKAPVFLHLNYAGLDMVARQKSNHYNLPWDMLIANGYGFMSAKYTQITADPRNASEGWKVFNGVCELWGRRDPKAGDNTGTLMTWAWGLMRGLDLAEQVPEIDAKRNVVIGSSRLGKAALLAAAYDERFAVCVPNQTGAVGVQLMKRDFGETLKGQHVSMPWWYCQNVWKYEDDPKSQPFDQHLLLACVAPRALLLECYHKKWFDPTGEFLAAKAASPVWEFLTGKGLGLDEMPPPYDGAFVKPPFGYVRRTECHGLSPYDWKWALDFANRVFGKE